MIATDRKICSRCGVTKPLEEFRAQKLGKFGRRADCKVCQSAYNDVWKKANKSRTARVNREYRAANRDHHLAYNKDWNRRNRGSIRAAHVRVRVGPVAGVDYTTTPLLLARVSMFDGRCYYCRAETTGIDHRIPLSRGGTHWPSNIVPCCRRCNASKGAKTEFEYISHLLHKEVNL